MAPACAPGASPFVERWFGDCLYDRRDALGFAAGLASIACWMVAQLPQMVRNARTRSADALSPWFLAEWLLGDTCNLIGCLLAADQLATMTYTAMYFICMDVVLVLQYIFYTYVGRLEARAAAGARPRLTRRHERAYVAVGSGLGPAGAAVAAAGAVSPVGASAVGGTRLRALAGRPHPGPPAPPGPPPPTPTPRRDAGLALAWVSAAFYLGSRLSQLARNAARGSADGLALAMFGTAVAANCLYAASILARARSPAAVAAAAPWLAGSAGTVALDVCIVAQARWLAGRAARRRAGGGARRGEGDADGVSLLGA